MIAALLLAAVAAVAAPHGSAQAAGRTTGGLDPAAVSEPLDVELRAPSEPAPAGGLLAVEILLSVEAPWHLYAHDFEGTGVPVALDLAEGEGLALEAVDYPQATKVELEPITGETLRLLEGEVVLRARLRVAPGHPPGEAGATLRLSTQACTDTMCLAPDDRDLHLAYSVRSPRPGEDLSPAGGAAPGAGSGPDAPDAAGHGPAPGARTGGTLQDRFDSALATGQLGAFLWLCVLLAFVSLLTPCVFPMIPITVSFFSKRGEAAGSRGVSYALAYGGGIVATYTGFGLAMAALLGASSLQTFAASPWVNLAVGALFVFFGLSLLGFYDLRPPRFLARRAESGAAVRGGYLPVIAMGFVFTVTAFTCTAPIVGTLLAALTAGGSLPLIVVGMLVYSVAFALPFVLLAAFPGALAALPGAGGWMNTLKVALGFLELVAALKFFSSADLVWDLELLPRPTLLAAAVMIVAALALYLLGAFRMPHDGAAPRRALSARTVAGLLAALAALYLASGLTGRTLDSWTESFLPPFDYAAPEGSASAETVAWREDLAAAKREAAASGRPLFLDFTGVTCQNCRKVEKSIFITPEFAEAIERLAVPVRLYTDRRAPEHAAGDAANRRLMEELGSVTLPLYVLLSPEGRVFGKMGYSPDFEPRDFVEFLEIPGP